MCDYYDCDGECECSEGYAPEPRVRDQRQADAEPLVIRQADAEPLVIRQERAERDRQRLAAFDTLLIANELAYRIKCIGQVTEVAKRLELIQDMLRYLWKKQDFLRENRRYLRVMRDKCKEWVADPDGEPIKETLVKTLEIFSTL